MDNAKWVSIESWHKQGKKITFNVPEPKINSAPVIFVHFRLSKSPPRMNPYSAIPARNTSMPIDNKPCALSEGEIGKDPIKKYEEFILKTDQVVNMNK